MGSAGKYISGGLQTIGGGVLTAMGMPEIGIPMMAGGVGGLAGGGSKGGGGGGFAVPGTNGTPSMDSINSALAANPSLSALRGQVTGASTATVGGQPSWLSMLSGGLGALGQGMGGMGGGSQGPQRLPAAPAFRGGASSPGFAQTLNGGGMPMPMRPMITPPTFNAPVASGGGPNAQLLRALGFTG